MRSRSWWFLGRPRSFGISPSGGDATHGRRRRPEQGLRSAVSAPIVVPIAVLSLLLGLGPLAAGAADWASIAVLVTKSLLAW